VPWVATLLSALQMGFKTLAIEKRSSEVWQILGAVRTEFNKYTEVVDNNNP
jgi:DNA recombination protein RmuC